MRVANEIPIGRFTDLTALSYSQVSECVVLRRINRHVRVVLHLITYHASQIDDARFIGAVYMPKTYVTMLCDMSSILLRRVADSYP